MEALEIGPNPLFDKENGPYVHKVFPFLLQNSVRYPGPLQCTHLPVLWILTWLKHCYQMLWQQVQICCQWASVTFRNL